MWAQVHPKNSEHPPLSKSEAFENVSEMSHASQRGKMIGLLITMFKLVSAVCSGGSAPPPALTLAAFPGKLLKDKSPVEVKCFKPMGVKSTRSSCWDLHPQSLSPWTFLPAIMISLNKSSAKHRSIISTVLVLSVTRLLTFFMQRTWGKSVLNISNHKGRQL